jgi:small GTP-binding protein
MYNQFDENKKILNYDKLCRVVFVGESGVGKTNIITKFRHNAFEYSYLTTIGIDFMTKTLNIRGTKIKLNIWDTAGQEKYRTITTSYYKTAHVVCICYDITNSRSLNNIEGWIDDIKDSNPNATIYLVGNKIDLNSERKITKHEINEYCKKNNFEHIEVSALDGTNIPNLFYDIAFKLTKQCEVELPRIVKINNNKNWFECCKIS